MSIRCSNCGAINRDGANFCSSCRNPLAGAAPGVASSTPGQTALTLPPQPAPTTPPSAPTPPGSLVPSPPGPLTPAPPVASQPIPLTPTPKRGWREVLTGAQFLTTGIVQSVKEKEEKPPAEPAHAFFTVAGYAVILPALLALCVAASLGGAVLIALLSLLGLGGVAIVLPLLLGLRGLLSGFIHREESRRTPKLELRVAEAGARRGLNITMWGQRQGGPINEWDEIEVWGKWDKGNAGSARAWRVKVVSSADPFGQRQSCDATIRAKAAFPWWLALAAVALALGMTLLVYWPLLARSASLLGR